MRTDGRSPLLERETEVAALAGLLHGAASGRGGIAVIRGEAGAGKTVLMHAARHEARRRGMLVLSARGADFEQDFTFGAVRQLLAAVVGGGAVAPRERLFAGSAGLCAALFPEEYDPFDTSSHADDTSAAMVEGLAWLVSHIAAAHRAGVLIAVDDLQVCDRASLRALARLTLALEEIGVAVVGTQRIGTEGRNADLIAWLAADPRAIVLDLAPLSAGAVGRMVAAELGIREPEVAEAARSVTGGNPFLLGELLAALRAESVGERRQPAAHRVRGLVPDGVLRSVTARLRRLGPAAGRLTQAVAVLGPGADLGHAGELAGISTTEALVEVERLVEERVLVAGERLAFRHPLLAAAVEREMSPLARAQLHARAAAVLRTANGPDERVAAHLLLAPPAGEPATVAVLRRAAAANMRKGGPDGAVPLLRRALEELPAFDDRGAVVLDLARAEAASGDPAAARRLQEALDVVESPAEKVAVLRELTRLQFINEHHSEAARTARRAWQLVPEDDDRSLDLMAEYVATGGLGSGTLDPDIRAETKSLAARLAHQYYAGELPDNAGLLVQVANMLAGTRGRQGDVRRLIERALRQGPLDEAPPFGLAPIWATLALVASDCLDLAGQVAARSYSTAEATGSIHNLGTTAFSVALVSLERGALERAERECLRAVELTRSGLPATLPWSAGLLATARRLRGDLPGARRAIELGERTDPDGYTYGIVVYHRALLALAEGDHRRAYADAVAARERLAGFRIQDYGLITWRLPAAVAAHRIGRPDEARQYAEEELALAHRSEAGGPIGAALLCRAVIESDPRREVELLEEAHAVLGSSAARVVRGECAHRLGAALRRTGSEAAAREHLLDAYELATECGAQPLVERVRTELRALGVRTPAASPRAPLLSPSELRTAMLAAAGHSNRAIAERLHLSTSTVEFHLTRTYRKLGIRSRSELSAVLERPSAAAAGSGQDEEAADDRPRQPHDRPPMTPVR